MPHCVSRCSDQGRQLEGQRQASDVDVVAKAVFGKMSPCNGLGAFSKTYAVRDASFNCAPAAQRFSFRADHCRLALVADSGEAGRTEWGCYARSARGARGEGRAGRAGGFFRFRASHRSPCADPDHRRSARTRRRGGAGGDAAPQRIIGRGNAVEPRRAGQPTCDDTPLTLSCAATRASRETPARPILGGEARWAASRTGYTFSANHGYCTTGRASRFDNLRLSRRTPHGREKKTARKFWMALGLSFRGRGHFDSTLCQLPRGKSNFQRRIQTRWFT